MLANYRQPCLKKWEVGKTPSELQSGKSFHIGLRQGWNAQPFTSKLLFLPLSIAATGTGFESDGVPIATTRKEWRPLSVESVGVAKESELIVFKQAPLRCFKCKQDLRLDKRMIFPTMFWIRSGNEKWQSYGCSKGFAQRAALHSNDHDSTDSTSDEKRSLVGSTSQTGWSCTKLRGASSCRREQASKSHHDDRKSKGEPRGEAKLAPGTRDHLPHYRYHLLVSLLNYRLLRFNEWLMLVRNNHFSPNWGCVTDVCVRGRRKSSQKPNETKTLVPCSTPHTSGFNSRSQPSVYT